MSTAAMVCSNGLFLIQEHILFCKEYLIHVLEHVLTIGTHYNMFLNKFSSHPEQVGNKMIEKDYGSDEIALENVSGHFLAV